MINVTVRLFLRLLCIVSSIVTLTTSAAHAQSGASLVAFPNPVVVTDGSGLGVTTLTYNSPNSTGTVSIWVGSQLFCRGAIGSTAYGTCTTGKWVGEGGSFVLKDDTTGAVLATEAVTVLSAKPMFSVSPNPIVVTDGTGLGVTTLAYSAPNVAVVLVETSGKLICAGNSSGTCATGKWVTDGMDFEIVDQATGITLASISANIRSPGPGCPVSWNLLPKPLLVEAAYVKFTTSHDP